MREVTAMMLFVCNTFHFVCQDRLYYSHFIDEEVEAQKLTNRAFPGGAVVENLSANCGGHGFEPWSGKIPHAAERLGL